MSAAGGVRARRRAAVEAEVLRIGREHLARHGAAALSLRAVARDLGVASSAVYRYLDSRDELLTRLIVAAFSSLADSVDAALDQLPRRAAPSRRFRTIADATRAWARCNPHEYALIYGSPVPGYHAPPERTIPAGTRVTDRLVEVLRAMPDLPPETQRDRRALGTGPGDGPAQLAVRPGDLRRGITGWNLVIGSISAELFEQYGPDIPADPDAFFAAAVDDALHLITGR